MDRFFDLNLSFFRAKARYFILAFAWISGLLLGAVFSASASAELSSVMLAAAHTGVSIYGLLAVRLLPFLLSALSIYFSQPILLYAVAFLKAFLYSYMGTGLFMACCSAGWILFSLLMFSDTIMLPILWLSWLRYIPGQRSASYRCHAICAFFAVAVGCIDYTYIAPYLAHLISF